MTSNQVLLLSACIPIFMYLSLKAAQSGVVPPCWFSAPYSVVDPAAVMLLSPPPPPLLGLLLSWCCLWSSLLQGATARHFVSGSSEKHFSLLPPGSSSPPSMCHMLGSPLYRSLLPPSLTSFPPSHTCTHTTHMHNQERAVSSLISQ